MEGDFLPLLDEIREHLTRLKISWVVGNDAEAARHSVWVRELAVKLEGAMSGVSSAPPRTGSEYVAALGDTE